MRRAMIIPALRPCTFLSFLFAPALTSSVDRLEPFKVPEVSQKLLKASRKHSFCKVGEKYGSGFRTTLAGHEISVVIMETPAFIKYNRTSQMLTGGFLIDVFEEITKRTGLEWRNSSIIVSPPASGETYDDWIAWAVRNYDIALGDFAATAERHAKGFRFTYPILNESPQLVGQVRSRGASVLETLFSFSRPFTARLWLAIFVTFIFVAFVYATIETKEYLLESKEYVICGVTEAETYSVAENTYWRNLAQSLYLTVASFTSGGIFRPHTAAGKTFVLTWTFTVLVLVSSYTANMASMIVISRSKEAAVTSVEDAIDRGLPVCVYHGGAFDNFMTRTYPSLHIRYPEVWSYENVRNGVCAAMVKDRMSFQIDKGLKKYNQDCDLDFIGQPLLDVHGGFVAQSDSGAGVPGENEAFCTDLLLDVINTALHDMSNDGWLLKTKEMWIRSVQDMRCGKESALQESSALDFKHFSGLFILQVSTALACWLMHRCMTSLAAEKLESSRSKDISRKLERGRFAQL
eukprot:TRINITY_DN8552_c0_g5_i1.p1 TRINITY_DN8552_c0_g5~~TRINITY_DN8552_c0_g5_i1.p1  ORF type:complete len:519 (-),score=66.04 TRINITY_DN8552_c0_g5_i1:107-1663(-)